MKSNLRVYAGNFLFALNVFIACLLLFEQELSIPQWLQPFGRMHPLILHFPIVLLLLSMAMELFRFKTDYHANDFYQRFTSNLLLIGVISAGFTVVMGIFLSKEEGYSASALTWHKWSGAAVFFIASLVYSCRDTQWYSPVAARAAATLMTLSLILAGHFGGALTHGDNFIWQPVLVQERGRVPVDEALVFEHVVRPVLEEKCISCHNAEKLKGKLMLTDSASIVKGGKTGALFVAGKPEESLLVRRIDLPVEDKKHMPPDGKQQLNSEERSLLYHWIKSGADFSRKITALPASDSLRAIALDFLETDNRQEEVFSFSSVPIESLEKLNSNYRVVLPLSRNSPALTVNIYNRASYSPRMLDELKEVETQVVSLDVARMPVNDEDLKFIVRLENLRKLNLNFTQVTGGGLQLLSRLGALQELSLTGTKVRYEDVRQLISACRNLKTLAIWNTRVTNDEIQRLQSEFNYISVLGGPEANGGPLVKLNPPRMKNRSRVFGDSIAVELFHPVPGVQIRYTTDGSDPDSVSSPRFEGNTVLRESAEIKARAFKSGWLSSDVATLNVYGSAHSPDTAILLSRLNRVHTASGAQTFFDRELGSFNANSPAWANNWGGVINHALDLLAHYDSPREIRSVAVNALIETENFIFPPASIEIWGGDDRDHMKLLHRCRPELPGSYRKPYIQLFDCSFSPQPVSYLRIIASPVMKLPPWHKRKGRPALLLVDEILVN